MARIKRTSAASSRRALAGLGAVGIVAGTVAFTAGVSAPAAHAAGKTLTYHCIGTAFGTALVEGDWSVNISTTAPAQVDPGATIPAPTVTAKVTTDDKTADTSRSIGIKSMDGTSDAPYKVFGKDFTSKLTIPLTQVPASGPIVTTAKGTGEEATAPTTEGVYPVTVGDFTGTLNNHTTADGSDTGIGLDLACTLNPGQDATIANIQVGAADPTSEPTDPTSEPTDPTSEPTDPTSEPTDPTSEPTDPTSEPTDPTSEPTDPTSEPTDPTQTATSEPADPTQTATSTDTATQPAEPATSTDASGPAIITDGGSSDGGMNAGVIGGAAVAAMGVGALGFGLRRRMNNN